MKFFFELESGPFNRSFVRESLHSSKEKILHWYPGSEVALTERFGWLGSKFYFEVDNLPGSSEEHMRDWIKKIETYILTK
jgi:hypothetical protein